MESYAESWESFLRLGSVFLSDSGHHLREYRIISARPHKRSVLLEVEGIESIEKAESLKGSPVLVRKKSLKKAGDDEFFWFELLGLRVYHEDGTYLGRLTQIIPTPANDVYVVTKGKKEHLIPATVEVVRRVDLEKGRMIISPLEGMLEIDES